MCLSINYNPFKLRFIFVTSRFRPDPVFMEFKPSVLATSALQCSLEGLVSYKANAHLLDTITLLPPTHMVYIYIWFL